MKAAGTSFEVFRYDADHAFVNETLDKVANFVAGVHGGQVQVLDRAISIETFPDGMGDDGGRGRTLGDTGWGSEEEP